MLIRHNLSIQPTYQSPRSDRSTAKDKQYVYSNPEVHIYIFRPIHLSWPAPSKRSTSNVSVPQLSLVPKPLSEKVTALLFLVRVVCSQENCEDGSYSEPQRQEPSSLSAITHPPLTTFPPTALTPQTKKNTPFQSGWCRSHCPLAIASKLYKIRQCQYTPEIKMDQRKKRPINPLLLLGWDDIGWKARLLLTLINNKWPPVTSFASLLFIVRLTHSTSWPSVVVCFFLWVGFSLINILIPFWQPTTETLLISRFPAIYS